MEELRVGVATGLDELEFGRILHAAVGHDGTILVADEAPLALRSFDARGNFLRWIGKARQPGDLAGDYRWVNGIETLPDGRFAIWDVSSDRVSILSEDGRPVGGFRADVSIWSGRSYDLEVDLEGNVYVRAVRRVDAPPGSGTPAPGSGKEAPPTTRSRDGADRSVYLKFSIDGELQGMVPLTRPDHFPAPGFRLQHATGFLECFTRKTVSRWSPRGYLVVGRNDAYEVELQRPDDAVLLTREVEPTPVNPDERAEWEALRDHARPPRSRLQPDSETPAELPPVPATKPLFRDIHVGDTGRIWVHRYVRARKRDLPPRPPADSRPRLSWIEPPTFDVFDLDGSFLGTVVLPDDTRVLTIREMKLWVVHTDEHGVERLVRLRVETQGT